MASVLMCASEGLPFVKTGGLADVIGSLPAALADQGNEVKVVLPLYRKIAEKYMNDLHFCCEYTVSINYHEVPVRIWSTMVGPVAFFFVQHQGYFERDSLYGYDDDGERFAYFQKAVIEMLNQLNYWPNIVHCHDWQTAMIPCMVRETHDHDDRYRRIKFVLTLHNMAYQGNFGPEMLDSCLGLPWYLLDNGNVRYDGGISFLKSGILYSDKVTTVSPTYAQEILTPQYGEHLEMVLNMRKYDLWGIVNGIDLNVWNPATDPAIPHHYNKVSLKANKAKDKAALQRELGLEVNPNVMLVGVVSRLTWQKGFYLLMEQLSALAAAPIQLAILGNGEAKIEDAFRNMENEHKGKVCFYRGYNEDLAHRIYAGSDLFLMPSLFEPCGISQLCSMRYGTLPLVRETGGLKDTVTPYNEYDKSGNGFSFSSYNANELMHTLYYAADVYYNRKADWETLQTNAMNTDVSWAKSAATYSQLYSELVNR
ncbi:glycogen synthase GlgA [uncultured Faecalibaculum sp.]|uniref:glycogen synthase GlgA n=1 Tax=uncultured Faecalibaculum sp. TaxID=1729681 RepID=UPI00263A0A6F|nr:glycogen synthase GlgA [uncultured Faecalibaculum sp.]